MNNDTLLRETRHGFPLLTASNYEDAARLKMPLASGQHLLGWRTAVIPQNDSPEAFGQWLEFAVNQLQIAENWENVPGPVSKFDPRIWDFTEWVADAHKCVWGLVKQGWPNSIEETTGPLTPAAAGRELRRIHRWFTEARQQVKAAEHPLEPYRQQCAQLRFKKYYLYRDFFPWFAPSMVEAGFRLDFPKNPIAPHREESPEIRAIWKRADDEWTKRTGLRRLSELQPETWIPVAVKAGYSIREAEQMDVGRLYKLARSVLSSAGGGEASSASAAIAEHVAPAESIAIRLEKLAARLEGERAEVPADDLQRAIYLARYAVEAGKLLLSAIDIGFLQVDDEIALFVRPNETPDFAVIFRTLSQHWLPKHRSEINGRSMNYPDSQLEPNGPILAKGYAYAMQAFAEIIRENVGPSDGGAGGCGAAVPGAEVAHLAAEEKDVFSPLNQGAPSCSTLDEIAANIPPLDVGNPDWVSNKVMARKLGLKTRVLATRRSEGERKTSDDKNYGLHNVGCFWRSIGKQHPYYYLPFAKEHAGHLRKTFLNANLDP